MKDFDKLERLRQLAAKDKADLFDFYHDNWDRLVEHAKSLTAEESPLRDIGSEIREYIANNPDLRNMEAAAFVLERVKSNPRQATKILLDYFRPAANGL